MKRVLLIIACLFSLCLSAQVTLPQFQGVMAGGADSQRAFLTQWYTALAGAATDAAKVVYIGDSVTVGYYATNPVATNGWKGRLNAWLATQMGTSVKKTWIDPLDARVSYTGAWAGLSIYQYGGRYTTEANATMTIAVHGDSAKLYWTDTYGSTKPFTVTVDSVLAFTCPTLTSAAQNGENSTTLNLGEVGDHTIVVNAGNPAYTVIGGVDVFDSSVPGGIDVYDSWAVSGKKMGDFYSFMRAVPRINPDLTIISLATNDYGSQTALATYSTQWDTLLTTIKQGTGSCLLIIPHYSQDTSKTIPESSYHDTIKAKAIANNCAYIDIPANAGWTDWATANAASLMYDALHPNNAGHASYATILEKLLK